MRKAKYRDAVRKRIIIIEIDGHMTYGRNRKEVNSTIMVGSIVLLGAVLLLLSRRPFWCMILILATGLAMLPTFYHRQPMYLSPRLQEALLATPYVAIMAGLIIDAHPTQPDTTIISLLSSAAFFALSMLASAYLGTYTDMRMNRQFVVVLAFMLYQAVLTSWGPIEYAYGVLFMKGDVVDNSGFMTNFVICTIAGMVMAFMANRHLRSLPSISYSDAPNREAHI
jgi:hypothetical protein